MWLRDHPHALVLPGELNDIVNPRALIFLSSISTVAVMQGMAGYGRVAVTAWPQQAKPSPTYCPPLSTHFRLLQFLTGRRPGS